jgi:hypothetical protein
MYGALKLCLVHRLNSRSRRWSKLLLELRLGLRFFAETGMARQHACLATTLALGHLRQRAIELLSLVRLERQVTGFAVAVRTVPATHRETRHTPLTAALAGSLRSRRALCGPG